MVGTGQLQNAAKQQSDTDAALTQQNEQNASLSSQQPRLERRVQLLNKEVESLRQVLKMYEDEAPAAAATTGKETLCSHGCVILTSDAEQHQHNILGKHELLAITLATDISVAQTSYGQCR